LEINAEQVFTIGLIAGVLQPVVVSDALQNVPAKGIYNWDPGAHFGIYSPDTFWFDTTAAAADKS
jgi:peptide/nickel transport system substrate-binding protein